MKNILKKIFNSDNGFTGQDILIAIFVTMLFLSLITTMIVNLSNTSYEIEKTKQVTELLTKAAEQISQMSIDSLEDTSEAKSITELSEFSSLEIPANITLKYKISTDSTQTTRTKIVTLIATYTNLKTTDNVELAVRRVAAGGGTSDGSGTMKPTTGDAYQYPFNQPSSTNGRLDDKNVKPVKYIWTDVSRHEGTWVVTTEDDKEWYSVEEGQFPTYVSSNESTSRYKVNGYTQLASTPSTFYIWVPRIAGTTNNYGYALETTNNILTERAGGGYVAQLPEAEEYNSNIFNSTERGRLLTIRKQNYGWGYSSSYSFSSQEFRNLPSGLQTLLNKFNAHVSNNRGW